MLTKAVVLCAGLALASVITARAGELTAPVEPRATAPVLLPGQSRQTTVRVFTGVSGCAVRVEVLRSAGRTLDAFTGRYVLEHWHGPPNSSKVVTFDYQMR